MQLITGRWISQAISAAAELKLADVLGEGEKSATSIAKETGTDGDNTYRLMRALASVGIFFETQPGTFRQTEMSLLLRSGPTSLSGMARFIGMSEAVNAWVELPNAIKSGGSGFERAHGLKAFDWMVKHPDRAQPFHEAMSGFSAQVGAAVSATVDFTGIDHLVDVGGGHGLLVSMLLQKYEAMKGSVIDLPSVVDGAPAMFKKLGVEARATAVPGSFFEPVTVKADAYILKSILHDWSDADSVRILKSVAEGAKPGARLFIVEGLVQPGNAPDFIKFLDLEMIAITGGGRERTEAEFVNLFNKTGFRHIKTHPTPSPLVVLEAIKQ